MRDNLEHPAVRKLPTGCAGCAMSLLYCQCERELNQRPCCGACAHPDVDGA